jgi:hypothetical protein
MNKESTMKCEFPDSIEIEICEVFENTEPPIKSTSRGIMINSRAELRNAFDSIHFSRESFLNKINEDDQQPKKHEEQRTSRFRGIVVDSRAE